jgi:dTDP-4-amino-4,6-dideoxygalactose transaminase
MGPNEKVSMSDTTNDLVVFNKPSIVGNELDYIGEAIKELRISGDGVFTKKCHQYFEGRYGFAKALLTTSCTDALEMAALLANIQEGDEVIAPTYTFVSTVNAFVLRGAKVVFVDSGPDNPNLDTRHLGDLITPKTKAIVPVHYAGIACDMDEISSLITGREIFLIEDAAQAIDSFYKGRPLGTIGHLAAFSFHETKNVVSGEGGMLGINSKSLIERAEILREKGTDRSRFFRGEVDKYGWVDVGSSFLPSDMIAAFLFAQLEHLDRIQGSRKKAWDFYHGRLNCLVAKGVQLPVIPDFATNNAHMFYLVTRSGEERTSLITFLRNRGVHAVFHYQSLHKSRFFEPRHDGRNFPLADRYSDCLIRLPLYLSISETDLNRVCDAVLQFYSS